MRPAALIDPREPLVPLEPPHLAEVRALYDAGQYVSAWARVQAHGAPWTTAAERVLRGRVLNNVGNARAARLEFLRAFRQAPADAEARYYRAADLERRAGPLPALEFIQKVGLAPNATAAQHAHWLCSHAGLLSTLRDFERADALMNEAEALAPGDAWVWVERSNLLEAQDRLAEAEDAVRCAVSIRPGFRPAVQQLGHLLIHLGRDEEALAVLRAGLATLQSPAVALQLAALEAELGLHAEAHAHAWRAVELSPSMDRAMFVHLAEVLSDAAYNVGDVEAAAAFCDLAPKSFHERLGPRLREATDRRRVELPVPFVRQHHMTCAPATLAAISALWSMPTDHLTLAADICYDGTPARSERKWAESSGWIASEFTVDWPTSVALLDRGIAFTLTTQETASSHLQAVVGYDAARRTLLIRDPGIRYRSEMDAALMFERYAASGPRGMVMVPRAEAARLDGLTLPDSALYDALFQIELALERHDRTEAGRIFETMRGQAPDHRLTLDGQLSLAAYDSDRPTQLQCAEVLSKRFPTVARLQLWRLGCLRNLARQEERAARLAELAAVPGQDPHVLLAAGLERVDDGRQRASARDLLRRGLRRAALYAPAYGGLATLAWAEGRKEESLRLRRLAACIADKDEALAMDYFEAARAAGRTTEALAFLEDRVRRFGAQSPQPWLTLSRGQETLDRTLAAAQTIDRALAVRVEDGELWLRAAELAQRSGRVDEARHRLAQAGGRVRKVDLLRASARLEEDALEPRAALALWRQVLTLEPLAMDAHAAIPRLLARLEGAPAGVAHLEEATARFPYHLPLHEHLLRWVRSSDPERARQVAAHLISVHPGNAWARRELVLALADLRRFEEAHAELRTARALAPEEPANDSVEGAVREQQGELAAARACYRRVLSGSLDLGYAIRRLFALCRVETERVELLSHLQAQFLERPLAEGEGIYVLHQEAQGVAAPQALLAFYERLAARWPDSWYAHSFRLHTLLELDRVDEALAEAVAQTERFPLTPGSWMDLAAVHRHRGDAGEQQRALVRTLELNPSWLDAARRLAALHRDAGRADQAREVLERLVRRAPAEGDGHAALAELSWELGDAEAAISGMEQALRADPDLDSGWRPLARWCAGRGETPRALELARTLMSTFPTRVGPCLALARMLPEQRLEERLATIREGLRRAPRDPELHDLRVVLLVNAHHFDEARAACDPPEYGGDPPTELRGRAAWILAEQGKLAEAAEEMARVVDREPRYVWGTELLAHWTCELDQKDAAVKWARRLVELEPDAARSHGYLGDALERAGDLAGATAALERAVELDPAYLFGTLELFKLALDANDLPRATALLDRSAAQMEAPMVTAHRIVLAVRRRDLAAVPALLDALLADPALDARSAEIAREALRPGGHLPLLIAAVRRAVRSLTARDRPRDGAVPQTLAQLWGEILAAQTPLGTWFSLVRRDATHPLVIHATAKLLEQVSEAGNHDWVVQFVSLRGRSLRRSAITWGALTYVLSRASRWRQLLAYARDALVLTGLEPWMLYNVVNAARAAGRRALAAELARRGLLLPPDRLTGALRVWLANDAALDGQDARARALLEEAVAPRGYEVVEFVEELTHALLLPDPQARQAKLRGWFPRVLERTSNVPWRRAYLDALAAHARRERSLGAWAYRLWAGFRLAAGV